MKHRIIALCVVVLLMITGLPLGGFSSPYVHADAGEEHTIIYNLNDGEQEEGEWNTYSEGEGLKLPIPKKADHAFLGWYADEDFTGEPIMAISQEDTGDKEFWAKWNEYFFYNDFENGETQGWSPRSSTVDISTDYGYLGSDYSVFVSGRTDDWNGATRILDPEIFVPGQPFSFSVMVMFMNGGDISKTFVLTIQYTDGNGETQWNRVTTTTGLKGQWVQLSANNHTIPEGAIDAQLLVETIEGETVDFYIDDAIGTAKGAQIGAIIEEPFTLTLTRGGTDNGTIATTSHIKNTEVAIDGKARLGHKFVRWESADVQVADANSVTTTFTMPDSNVEVTAIYEELTSYTIDYELNGGTQQSGNSWDSYYGGEEKKLPERPTKVGNTFGGWYANAELTGTVVKAITDTETGNKKFWAKWILNTFIVDYELDGGTQQLGSEWGSYTYGTVLTLPTAPEKEHYTFEGWYDNQGLTGDPITEISAGSIGNKKFWAKWAFKNYSITYNLNGGTQQSGSDWGSYTYGTGLTLPTAPIRKDYKFEGWYDNAELKGNPIKVILDTDSGTKQFWAKWSGDSSKVTLDKSSVSLKVGETVTLKATATGMVTYKSSNEKVATVTSTGKITAIKTGEATITAVCGKATAICKVIVKKDSIKISSVKVGKKSVKASKKTIEAKKGKTVTIKIKKENTVKAISVKVSNKKAVKYSLKNNKIKLTVIKKVKKNVKVTISCGSRKITRNIKTK